MLLDKRYKILKKVQSVFLAILGVSIFFSFANAAFYAIMVDNKAASYLFALSSIFSLVSMLFLYKSISERFYLILILIVFLALCLISVLKLWSLNFYYVAFPVLVTIFCLWNSFYFENDK